MKNTNTRRGFTLIELLVVVLIIGVLTAVAVSQYQKAVYKSRFTAMMPIAKTIANANEVYYTENGQYASTPAQLSVSAQENAEDGTEVSLYSNPEELSFVLAHNDNIPNIRYVVYQKFSANFPDTAWCEAGDEQAEDLCVSLGGVLPEGVTGNSSGQEDNWKAYLLSGQAQAGDSFASAGGGDDNNGEGEGSANTDTPTIAKMSAEEAQAFADSGCWDSQGCVGIANDDGTVSVCYKTRGKVTEEGKCVGKGTGDFYEIVYNADGTKKRSAVCSYMSGTTCYAGNFNSYNADGSYTQKYRSCANQAAINNDGSCSNEQYDGARDEGYNSRSAQISYFPCSAVGTDGQCTVYSSMYTVDRSYDGNTSGSIGYKCSSISGTTCNNYNPTNASKEFSDGSWNEVRCWNSSGGHQTGNSDGTCPQGGYSWKSKNSAGQTTTCTSYSTIDWENATCS